MWARTDVDGFFSKYARARDVGADAMADEIIELAKSSRLGVTRKTKTLADGSVESEEQSFDAVDAKRLHVDTLKWYVAKLAPRRWSGQAERDDDGQQHITITVKGGLE